LPFQRFDKSFAMALVGELLCCLLQDVLAGRKTGGNIEGDILISGHPKEQESFRRISGCAAQPLCAAAPARMLTSLDRLHMAGSLLQPFN
jgi:hypothetical protein